MDNNSGVVFKNTNKHIKMSFGFQKPTHYTILRVRIIYNIHTIYVGRRYWSRGLGHIFSMRLMFKNICLINYNLTDMRLRNLFSSYTLTANHHCLSYNIISGWILEKNTKWNKNNVKIYREWTIDNVFINLVWF